jgi:hypothetical protein
MTLLFEELLSERGRIRRARAYLLFSLPLAPCFTSCLDEGGDDVIVLDQLLRLHEVGDVAGLEK